MVAVNLPEVAFEPAVRTGQAGGGLSEALAAGCLPIRGVLSG